MRWLPSRAPSKCSLLGITPRSRYSFPGTKKPTRTFCDGSVRHSMRKVVGLRLPTIAGTHGSNLPLSSRLMPWTGMKACRASVSSGSCVEKKSGHSTTAYITSRTPALNMASRCFRKRHHTSVQLDATEIRSSDSAPLTVIVVMSLAHTDARIQNREQDVRQQRPDNRQEAVNQ